MNTQKQDTPLEGGSSGFECQEGSQQAVRLLKLLRYKQLPRFLSWKGLLINLPPVPLQTPNLPQLC